jgi:hypothetical protein
MPVKQRAVGCQASKALPLCQSNTDPQETKEVSKSTRMKTVPKHIQKWYNLGREEVHGYASLSFLAEILKAYSPSSPSLLDSGKFSHSHGTRFCEELAAVRPMG